MRTCVTGTNSGGTATFGPVTVGDSTDYAVGTFSSACLMLPGSFHIDKPTGSVDGTFTVETAQVEMKSRALIWSRTL